MKRLLLKFVMASPLVVGIALVCAQGTGAERQMPGRTVGSAEAGSVLGTACFYVKSINCENCTGTYSTAGTKSNTEVNTGGCSTGCDAPKITGPCSI